MFKIRHFIYISLTMRIHYYVFEHFALDMFIF